jgi:thiosulfate/3-mercaptopyruvate sulfurtransferase
MESLVSTQWLAGRLGEANLVVVDASWHMPATARKGREEFRQAHIPGARFFDIDALSDLSNPLPHMLPGAGAFGRAMEEIGIGSDERIVVYDHSPLRTAARGWFMLRHFGASQVAILDGGFAKWLAEARPVESGEPEARNVRFEAAGRQGEIVTKKEILGGLELALIDARGAARFEGAEPDPRPGVAPGHIPGALNLAYSALYNEDGTFKTREELMRLFKRAGADPQEPFAASCGSGVTANSLIFAAHLLGNDEARLYDGSWSEWGADPETAKVVGAPGALGAPD